MNGVLFTLAIFFLIFVYAATLSANFVTLRKPIEMCFLMFNLEALIMADNDEGLLSHDS